jgi:hypothetical protein
MFSAQLEAMMSIDVGTLTEKIHSLTAEEIAEVDDFVERVRQRDAHRGLTRDAALLSARAFELIWENPEDAAYDVL